MDKVLDQKGIDFAIMDTYLNMEKHLSEHGSISVGVSGGSDSTIIVHMLATYFPDYLSKMHFMYSNTGLEYNATIRHINYLESRYNIRIDRVRGEPVPAVVKKYGFPILSKHFSQVVEGAAKGQKSRLALIEGTLMHNGKKSSFNLSQKQSLLAKDLISRGVKVSNKCCDYAKKMPHKKYVKEHKCDLIISGERQAEGGARSKVHKGCFETGKNKIDKYMPLFWWSDEVKDYYKLSEGIRYSECYEVWGMKRTGCAGCPFNSRVGEELKLIEKYEPSLYKACMHTFGESYRLMDKFGVHRRKIFDDDGGENEA